MGMSVQVNMTLEFNILSLLSLFNMERQAYDNMSKCLSPTGNSSTSFMKLVRRNMLLEATPSLYILNA